MPATAEELAALWTSYRRDKSSPALNDLIRHYTPLVTVQWRTLSHRLPEWAPAADFLAVGLTALATAIETDYRRNGCTFEARAGQIVRRRMISEARRQFRQMVQRIDDAPEIVSQEPPPDARLTFAESAATCMESLGRAVDRGEVWESDVHCFRLHYVNGYSITAIAQERGIHFQQVKRRLFVCRQSLRRDRELPEKLSVNCRGR